MKKNRNMPNWRKGDFLRLEKAVSEFNAKIVKLQKEEQKTYLPEIIDAKEMRTRITSKNELTRYVRELRKFSEKGQEELFVAESGEKFTKWEAETLKKQANIRMKQLEKDLKPYKIKDEFGNTKVQMGNTEARAIQFNIDRLKNLFKTKNITEGNEKTGKLDRLKTYIRTTGTLDFNKKKARIYKENYLNVLKNYYSGFDGYKEMLAELKKLSPEDFYERMKNADDINIVDLQYQSDKVMSQQGFYNFLNKVGVTLDKTEEIVEVEE